LPTSAKSVPHNRGGFSSAPSGENRFRFHDFFRSAGEIKFEFSGTAGDFDLNVFQTAGDHPEAELFIDFAESVLLEAIAHGPASARVVQIAMEKARIFNGAEDWSWLIIGAEVVNNLSSNFRMCIGQ
jgi:hypothetical protein